MSLPRVSLVTGTWQRTDQILALLENVRAQTYPQTLLEWVIVSDGPDPALEKALYDIFLQRFEEMERGIPWPKFVFASLGFHASGFFQDSISAPPYKVAQLMASGDLQMWLADDERMEDDCIEALVRLLLETDSDFVYPRSEIYFHEDLGFGDRRMVLGVHPPVSGQITTALYRRELLDYRMFELHVGSGTDWDQVFEWMKAGARYAMLDRVVHYHRVDKIGAGPNQRIALQPLRGHRLGGGDVTPV